MGRNARRRKRYAEMTENEKAEISCRGSRARLFKKGRNSSRSYIHSVPFGYVESGVCFPNASPEVATRIHDSQDEFPMANRDLQISLLASDNNQNAVAKDGLDYLSSRLSCYFNLSGHALACPVRPDLVQSGVDPQEFLHGERIETSGCQKKSSAQKRKGKEPVSTNVSANIEFSKQRQGNMLCAAISSQSKEPMDFSYENRQTLNAKNKNSNSIFEPIEGNLWTHRIGR